MKKIIFICTGNVCRSPMAHYYMQKKVEDIGIQEKYLIDSCGTFANAGEAATNNAIETMKQYGVHLENHSAKKIEDVNLNEFDLILTMTKQQKTNIIVLYPNVIEKVYTLKEYANDNNEYVDIDDPWGLNMEVYSSVAKEIVDNVDQLLEKV